jgi:hypothetical protein
MIILSKIKTCKSIPDLLMAGLHGSSSSFKLPARGPGAPRSHDIGTMTPAVTVLAW